VTVRRGSLTFAARDGRQARLDTVWRTETFMERNRGLLGRAPLETSEGMLITPCNAVHSLGMRYAIDLAYLDRRGRIRRLVRHLRPWRASLCLAAASVLEMPAGTVDRLGLVPDMETTWHD